MLSETKEKVFTASCVLISGFVSICQSGSSCLTKDVLPISVLQNSTCKIFVSQLLKVFTLSKDRIPVRLVCFDKTDLSVYLVFDQTTRCENACSL